MRSRLPTLSASTAALASTLTRHRIWAGREYRYGLAESIGLASADTWQEGLLDALAGLATLPHRCPIAREDRLFQREVRQLIYRLPRSRISHRILFTIQEPPDDTPFVFVLHIRHGARGPMIADEADVLQAE